MFATKMRNGGAMITAYPSDNTSVEVDAIPEGDGRLMFDGENLYREPSITSSTPTNNYSLAAALTD